MLKYGMFERDREQQTPKFYYNYDKTLAFCEIQLNILFKGAMEYCNLRAKYQLRLWKRMSLHQVFYNCVSTHRKGLKVGAEKKWKLV